jgi:hypothetical protein
MRGIGIKFVLCHNCLNRHNKYQAEQLHFYGMVNKLTLSPLKKAIKSKNCNQFESTLYSNWR